MNKQLIVDLATIDFDRVVADIDEIRRHNPQRYEMEQLTAIVYEDLDRNICVGYKDTTPDDFWTRGHMPGTPLMPGVLMLEAAAQLCSYIAHRNEVLGNAIVGFGGLEEVRFRDPVFPGERLILMCEQIRSRPGRMLISRFQGIVQDSLVVEGILKGVAIPPEALKKGQSERSD